MMVSLGFWLASLSALCVMCSTTTPTVQFTPSLFVHVSDCGHETQSDNLWVGVLDNNDASSNYSAQAVPIQPGTYMEVGLSTLGTADWNGPYGPGLFFFVGQLFNQETRHMIGSSLFGYSFSDGNAMIPPQMMLSCTLPQKAFNTTFPSCLVRSSAPNILYLITAGKVFAITVGKSGACKYKVVGLFDPALGPSTAEDGYCASYDFAAYWVASIPGVGVNVMKLDYSNPSFLNVSTLYSLGNQTLATPAIALVHVDTFAGVLYWQIYSQQIPDGLLYSIDLLSPDAVTVSTVTLDFYWEIDGREFKGFPNYLSITYERAYSLMDGSDSGWQGLLPAECAPACSSMCELSWPDQYALCSRKSDPLCDFS